MPGHLSARSNATNRQTYWGACSMKKRLLLSSLLLAMGLQGSSCAVLEGEEVMLWDEQPHHLSVLMASTFEDGEEAPTLGVDYEYRVNDFLGVGGVAEYAFGDIEATTLLLVADLHLTNQFIVQTGPGVEFIDDEELAVYRVGVLYEFERDGFTVSPQLHYDITSDENAVILGIALGFAF